MLTRIVNRSTRYVATSHRSFTTSVRSMAEGDTGSGASRTGGGDAFSKREEANENMYIKDQEKMKLRALMKKLQDQKKNIDDLHQELEAMTKEGEKKSN